MSRNDQRRSGNQAGRLTDEQQATWLAWMRVMLRMQYEMNHQLLRDQGLSLSHYHVLNALSITPERRMGLSALAALIGWERSRLSHLVRRMEGQGLVERTCPDFDRRVTEVALTDHGAQVLETAAVGHVDLVREVFFGGLDPELLAPLRRSLEQIHDQLLECGELPGPALSQQVLPPYDR